MNASPRTPKAEKCWRQTGAWGDQSCPELTTHLHCHNCPVYIESGQELFEQTAPEDYLREWQNVLAQEAVAADTQLQSVMVFQVGNEWMALDTVRLVEVHKMRTIHRVPHMRQAGFLGLVNLRGRLHLCLSFAQLFGLPAAASKPDRPADAAQQRLVIIEKEGAHWAAKVDHVEGIFRFATEAVERPPVTVSQAANTFTKGLITIKGRKLAWLDDELLFHHLKSNLF